MTAKEEKMLYNLYEDACDCLDNESAAIMERASELSSILPELADCEDVDDVSGILGEFFAY